MAITYMNRYMKTTFTWS